MTIGKVDVTNEDLSQGPTTVIEKTALFVGVTASGRNEVKAIGAKTNLVDTFGAAASGTLVKQLEAARLNGGQNWQGYAVGIDDKANYAAAIDLAFASINAEYIVITDPVIAKAELEAFFTKAVSILNGNARRVYIIGCAAGIDPATESWSAYQTAMAALVDGVAAERVMVVPNLFGTDQGFLAGRLATNKASIADSPMRVITGPAVGLGDKPVDVNGVAYDMAQVTTLEGQRFSCVQWYDDYDGYYFTDGNTLAAEGSDYSKIENLRVVDKAARQVRLLAIKRIADRKLNNTKKSIANHQSYFAGPLRDMAKSTKVGSTVFPGEIKPPGKDAISIEFTSTNKAQVGISLQPYNAAKEISISIALDMSSEE